MRRRLAVALILLGVGGLWYVVNDELSLERLVESERQLRERIRSQPGTAFGLGFSLYVLVSVFPGTAGKAAIAGWLFGFWPGLFMVVGALTMAGVVGFGAARYLFRDALHRHLGSRLARFDQALELEGAVFLLTLRLLHVPYTLVNYSSGVSAVSLRTFVWTTAVGLIPGTVVLVGLGAGLPSLSTLVEHGVVSLMRPPVLAGLMAIALLPYAVRWIVRRLR